MKIPRQPLQLTDRELNTLILEFEALTEFFNEPECKRNDKAIIRNILKKAREEAERRLRARVMAKKLMLS